MIGTEISMKEIHPIETFLPSLHFKASESSNKNKILELMRFFNSFDFAARQDAEVY